MRGKDPEVKSEIKGAGEREGERGSGREGERGGGKVRERDWGGRERWRAGEEGKKTD